MHAAHNSKSSGLLTFLPFVFGLAALCLCAVFFGVNACVAQTNDSVTFTNWGESIEGVQMSIAITNNIIADSSQILIKAEIRNSSTNIIQLVELPPEEAFVVTSTSDYGTIYLTPFPDSDRYLMAKRTDLKPGESRDWNIPVTSGNNGDGYYDTLKATRNFSIDNSVYVLVSNSLKVKYIPDINSYIH